jgi:MFS transporter, MHS family, proline/betaine transporter
MFKEKTINKPLLLGHVFETFDNTLYGFFAVLLAPIFFPATSYAASLMASYGAFAAGFLARPLGAIVFGLYGDRVGRRKALLWSMGLVGIPTFTIGIIPSYESIGITAAFVLIACRLTQGFFLGGEYTGVNLYLSENNFHKNLGAQTGILISSGVFGAACTTMFGAIVTLESMPSWAWRIPFLFGGIAAVFICFYRLSLSETNSFQKEKESNNLLKFPISYLFKEHKLDLLIACLIAGLTIIPLYYSTIFGNRLFQELGYTHSQSMLLNMTTMIFVGIIVLFSGKLADKIGFGRHMLLGTSLTAFFAFPAFYLILSPSISTLHIYGFIGILDSVGVIIIGCTMPYIASFFPTKCRYSGVALSVTTGQAIFGGTAPLMASLLTDIFQSRLAPAFWLTFIALAAATGIYYKSFRGKTLDQSLTNESNKEIPNPQTRKLQRDVLLKVQS